jgi:tetratricopeptide (TPR) repeat protein
MLLEQGVPLSQSKLWQLQRDFFARKKLAAWSEGTVPHYISNNPSVARSYSQVLMGWLRDLDARGSLDRTQPIYVVELGTGAGRLAFHLMKQLFQRLERSLLASLKVVYVMTDFTPENVAGFRAHPQLAAWVAAGRLDFARFDAEQDRSFTLLESGVTLGAATLANPMAVVANYFFDTLRHDVFQLEEGRVSECLVKLSAESEVDALETFEVELEPRAIGDGYYGVPAFDALLRDYAALLPAQTHLLIPIGALRCLEVLVELTRRRLLVLVGDKGYHHLAELESRAAPLLTRHGSFSLMVNFDALGRHAGRMLSTWHHHASFDVCALVYDQGSFVETEQAFASAVESFGPDDFFLLREAVGEQHARFDLAQMLAWLRLSSWDSRIFVASMGSLVKLVRDVPPEVAEEVAGVLRLIWEHHFHIGEPIDVPFALGVVSYHMGRSADAVEYMRHSLRLHGEDVATLFNLGSALLELGRKEEALAAFDRVLEKKPDLAAATSARERCLRT